MPFRFARFDDDRYILTNLAGEYALLSNARFRDFAEKRLAPHTPAYDDLKSLHCLSDAGSQVALDLLAASSPW